MCEFVLHRFAKESFSSITVLMSRPSLRAFIELAQHPFFGPAVKRINISALHDASPLFPKVPAYEALGSSNAGRVVVRAKTIGILQSCLARFCKERKPMTDGSAERTLSIAFKAFAQRGQRFQLKISDREYHTIGQRDLVRAKTFREHLVWHLDWKTTFEQTIRAATIHDCKITALMIDGQAREHFVNDSGLEANDIKQQLSFLCLNLAHL